MQKSTWLAVAVLAFGVSGMAQAGTPYSASLDLTVLPSLDDHDADTQAPVIGRWLDYYNKTKTSAHTLDHLQTTWQPDMSQGGPGHWDTRLSNERNAYAEQFSNAGAPFGNGSNTSSIGEGMIHSRAEASGSTLSSVLDFGAKYGSDYAGSDWSRQFMLMPHASLTISAVGRISTPGLNGQPLTWSSFSEGSPRSSDMQEASYRVGFQTRDTRRDDAMGSDVGAQVSLSARLLGDHLNQDTSGLFQSHIDADTGLMSLTLTNNSDHRWEGVLSAETSVSALLTPLTLGMPSPVPEPDTWACLALGLGVMGTAARRKHQAALRAAT